MTTQCEPSVRPLHAWEIQEARRVFGGRLDYDPIRVHECTRWTNSINRLSLALRGLPYTPADNAITLGHHLYFPIQLLEKLVEPEHPEHYKICWLIHELTHAWQYQKLGWRYLALALQAQVRLGAKAYEFGGEQGLLSRYRLGGRLVEFNLEQQADIARSYYEQLSRGKDASAWLPFITEFQEHIDLA